MIESGNKCTDYRLVVQSFDIHKSINLSITEVSIPLQWNQNLFARICDVFTRVMLIIVCLDRYLAEIRTLLDWA